MNGKCCRLHTPLALNKFRKPTRRRCDANERLAHPKTSSTRRAQPTCPQRRKQMFIFHFRSSSLMFHGVLRVLPLRRSTGGGGRGAKDEDEVDARRGRGGWLSCGCGCCRGRRFGIGAGGHGFVVLLRSPDGLRGWWWLRRKRE